MEKIKIDSRTGEIGFGVSDSGNSIEISKGRHLISAEYYGLEDDKGSYLRLIAVQNSGDEELWDKLQSYFTKEKGYERIRLAVQRSERGCIAHLTQEGFKRVDSKRGRVLLEKCFT